MKSWIKKPLGVLTVAAAIAVASLGGIIVADQDGGGGLTITCDQTAANAAGLKSALSVASNGQTICLTAAVNYGTFTGTSKTVTIIAQSGTGPVDPTSGTLTIDFDAGDGNFTIDGNMSTWGAGLAGEGLMLLGMPSSAATFTNGAHDITLKNFRSSRPRANRTWVFDPAPTNSNITIDHAVFFDEIGGETTFFIWCDPEASCNTGITIKNSLQIHSSTDFFKLSQYAKVSVLNNRCIDSHETNGAANHTDCIQFNAGNGSTIRGNWISDADQCISGFDGQANMQITHNVLVDCDAHAITMFADDPASTVAWNTLGPGGQTAIQCGTDSTRPAISSLTNIYNNIVPGGVSLDSDGADCTPTRNDHNVTATQTYVGGPQANMSRFDSFSDFCLAPASSGYTAADDGGQVGVCGGDYDPATDGPPSDTEEGI